MAALAAPATPITRGWSARAGGALLSLATAIVIFAVTMVPFFTPAWIHFEQNRAGSAALTGYTPANVDRVTDSIVHDLILGGDFEVRTNSCPPLAGCPALPAVLDQAEVSHMQDVRGVLGGLPIVALVALAGLAVAAWRIRTSAGRAVAWAAVRRGAAWLATLLVVLGVVAIVAFDAAFELFHRILFPGGNFDFDPRTEKLVQLFPEQFWSETALTYGAVAIATALLVGWYARRRSTATGSGS